MKNFALIVIDATEVDLCVPCPPLLSFLNLTPPRSQRRPRLDAQQAYALAVRPVLGRVEGGRPRSVDSPHPLDRFFATVHAK